MNRSSVVGLLCAAVLSFPGSPLAHGWDPGPRGHWVNTWVSMPQLTETSNLPPAPFTDVSAGAVFVNSTLRQTALVTIGGRFVRLRFSNAFGTTPLTLDAVHLALPDGGAAGVSAIQPSTDKTVTFAGKASVTIPAGAQIVSDAVPFDLEPSTNVAVTLFTALGQQGLNDTSHPGSRTTSWMIAGNHVADADLNVSGVASALHWYFLSGIEVWAPEHAAAVVVIGDSISDGRGSTNNQNNRWPNQLAARLLTSPFTADVAVLNQAAGGNRLLNDGLGPNVLARLDRDLLSQSGVRWAIVYEGVNDIGTAEASEAAQTRIAGEIIDAYEQIIRRAHAQGIAVYGATITPFKGNGYYDQTGFREAARQKVNAWIRTSGRFDAVIDFDAAVRDPADPAQLLQSVQFENLHLTPDGYRMMADAVPAALFWHR